MGRGKAKNRSYHEDTLDPEFLPTHVDDDEISHNTEEFSDIPLLSSKDVDKRKKKNIKKNKREGEKTKHHQNVGSKSKKKGPASSGWRQAAIDSRCSPIRLSRLCSCLTKEQIEIVNSMGFGSIFHIKTSLDRRLCCELVSAVDLTTMCMYIKGQPIRISHEDVGLVFDLPVTGLKIPTSITKEQESLLKEFVGVNDTQLLQMIKQGTTDALFKRAFILYVLSGFFCPTSYLRPSPRLMGAIVDVDDVPRYNWSLFIFEWLVHQITLYKTSEHKIRSIGGCLFFLMIVYFHRQPLGSMGLASGPPLVAYWDDERVRRRIRLERKNIKGIFYRIKDRAKLVDPNWLNSTFKSQIVREWVVHHLHLFKKLDDAVIAGKYDTSLVPKILIFGFDESSMGADEKNQEMTGKCTGSNEETSNEQTPDKRVIDAHVESVIKSVHAGTSNTSRMIPEKKKLKLYTYCTKDPRGKDAVAKEVLISINGHFLDRRDTASMRPRQWLLNTVVSFASMMLNDVEKTQMRSRYCLDTWFMDKITFGLEAYKKGHHLPWESIPKELRCLLSHEQAMGKCNLIFAPVVMEGHWWCYVLHRQENKLILLDSMIEAHVGDRLLVDEFAVIRFQELLQLLDRTLTADQVKLELVREPLPQQEGGIDCGIYTIKYMEMWDGVTRYHGGLTMPVWTRSDITTFRRELLVQWVLDDRNEYRVNVLKAAKVDCLLPPYLHKGDATHFIGTPTTDIPDDQLKDLDTVEDKVQVTADAIEEPPFTSNDRLKTYGRKRRVGSNSHVDSDKEVDAMENPPSTIAGRAKTLPRKRMAGPQNRTPYTERHVKQKKKGK